MFYLIPTDCKLLMGTIDALDRALGNEEGWRELRLKTDQEGAATTVYAAFEPALQGEVPVSRT